MPLNGSKSDSDKKGLLHISEARLYMDVFWLIAALKNA